MSAEPTWTLTIACPDRVGIVAAVSRFVAERGGWIVEANHHADAVSQRFFMRNTMKAASLAGRGVTLARFRAEFAPIAADYGMDWAVSDSANSSRRSSESSEPSLQPPLPLYSRPQRPRRTSV